MRTLLVTGCTARRYDQFETSPEAIEQELRPAVCERRQTDRFKANYSIDSPKITAFISESRWQEQKTMVFLSNFIFY